MTNRGADDAWIAAERQLRAAVEHIEFGRYKTAASLLRAGARYLERFGEDRGPGEVITLPSPACLGGARRRHAME